MFRVKELEIHLRFGPATATVVAISGFHIVSSEPGQNVKVSC